MHQQLGATFGDLNVNQVSALCNIATVWSYCRDATQYKPICQLSSF